MPFYRTSRPLVTAESQGEGVTVKLSVVDMGLPDGVDILEIEMSLAAARQLALAIRPAIEIAQRNAN